MAMSDAASSHHGDWVQLYHRGLAGPAASSPAAESTVVSTTSAGLAPAASERRGKPVRRRSRASRKAPTTLLNADAANFRAMVQQFTGIPAPPAGFPTGLYQPGGGGGFGFGVSQVHPQPQSQVHPQPQFGMHQQQQQLYQYTHQQQLEQPLMFTLGTGSNAGGEASQFLQGFNGNSSAGVYRGNVDGGVDMSGGFMLDGAAAPLQLIRPPSADTKPNNGGGGGFML